MLKNIKDSFLWKAEQKSKALVLGIMLLLFAVHTAKAQNNLNMRFYGIRSAAQAVGVDVTSLDAVFGSVTVNGVVMTTDAFGTVNGIEDLPTSVSSYNGIQMIYVNGFNFPGYIGSISQQQADALISFVKQGGVLVGSMEGMIVLGANQDFNKYVGERLLLQPGVNITPTAANSTIPNTAFFYHNNNGPLNLNVAAVSVPTTTSGSTFSGVPSESIIFTTAKPTTTAQCTVNRVLDFVAPSYPGDGAALTAGIKGFAYLSGEVHGSLTCGLRNDTQANVNLSNLIYDFLYNPSAMVTRRAWSQTLANVNSFCPVTSFPVENIPVTNICPATTVNLSSHHTATPPVGASVVWFDNNTHTGTPVADPMAVGISGTYYAFYYDSVYNCYSPPSFPIKVTIVPCPDPVCYKPGITAGTALDTKVGITALSRAGSDNTDNWPMTRKGGWLALEAKTKGFVPNRVAFSGGNPVGIAPANFVEGMMVYDDTNKCMKIYTQKVGDPGMAWHCITTQACPD